VERTKYELAINLKTAKSPGLTIPQSLPLRANQLAERFHAAQHHAPTAPGLALLAPAAERGRWTQRAWFRGIFERANVEHESHFVDASDALCRSQLKDRSRTLPPGPPWTTDAEFDAITVYFQPPSGDEGFNVVRHERA
jgi:hypothetical protein